MNMLENTQFPMFYAITVYVDTMNATCICKNKNSEQMSYFDHITFEIEFNLSVVFAIDIRRVGFLRRKVKAKNSN